MGDRERILAAIRRANAGGAPPAGEPFDVARYARYDLAHFAAMLELYGCIVYRMKELAEFPATVAKAFAARKIAPRLVVAEELAGLAWQAAGLTALARWDEAQRSAATGAAGAIAETGQLVITAANDRQQLSLLADNHCVALDLGKLQPALDQLPAIIGDRPSGVVTLIAGASRTADIEQTLIMGAHGPRCLIVCLYPS